MSYLDTFKAACAEMSAELGTWGDQPGGYAIPRFVTAHVLPLLSFGTNAVAQYIAEYSHSQTVPVAISATTAAASTVNSLGLGEFFGGIPTDPIDIDTYLSQTYQTPGKGADTRTHIVSGIVYQPHIVDWRGAGVTMASWASIIGYGAYLLKGNAITAPLSKGDCLGLVSTMAGFASTMDSVNMRPSTTWGRMALGLKELKTVAVDATKEAASIAGEGLAGAADLAGQTGGKFLASFLSNAGITALAVTAGALYILLR